MGSEGVKDEPIEHPMATLAKSLVHAFGFMLAAKWDGERLKIRVGDAIAWFDENGVLLGGQSVVNDKGKT